MKQAAGTQGRIVRKTKVTATLKWLGAGLAALGAGAFLLIRIWVGSGAFAEGTLFDLGQDLIGECDAEARRARARAGPEGSIVVLAGFALLACGLAIRFGL